MLECCGVSVVNIAAGSATALALGSLWYSSFMFGGCSQQSMPQRSVGMCFALEFLNSAVATWALFSLLNLLDPMTMQDTLYYSALISLASAVPAAVAKHIWKNVSLHETFVAAGFSVALGMALGVLRSYLG